MKKNLIKKKKIKIGKEEKKKRVHGDIQKTFAVKRKKYESKSKTHNRGKYKKKG